ncbi:MAG TPA: hypothetical protein VH416_00175 [Gaiellaceae bacterium]|jgi:hypothetical protein
MSDPTTCISCGEAAAVDLSGYCGHCHWEVRAEIAEGMVELRAYLLAWSRYSDWCDERGLEAA